MKSELCRETEEGALGEKSLSGFRKALFYFYVFKKKNIILRWKIVEVSKVSVLYIYIINNLKIFLRYLTINK